MPLATLEESIGEPKARLRFPDARVLRQMMESLGKILEEARFTITEEGVRVLGMDPAKMALMEVVMPRDAFLEYEVEGEVEMGLNLESFINMIKRGRKGDTVLLLVTDDKVLVRIDAGVVKRYLLPNIEVVTEVPGELQLEHDVEASVIADVIQKAVKDAEIVSNVLVIEGEDDTLKFKARGEGARSVEVKLTSESSSLLYLDVHNPATSAYDLQYLKNALSLAKVAEAVDVKFSSDKPLELVFKSPEGSRVRLFLAPTALE
ncbi:MAG: DNA polymerase sliding clamp [Desulfurococcales archaeon]|nr:DNA polymerase sliding clamp [Desulfurococcales archaeon]